MMMIGSSSSLSSVVLSGRRTTRKVVVVVVRGVKKIVPLFISTITVTTTTMALVVGLLLLLLFQQECDGLTPAIKNNNKNMRRPIQRIAIVGSGISGLSLAHAILKNKNKNDEEDNKNMEVLDIFDARPKLDTTAGAGIQLNGGLSVLGKIDKELQNAVYDAGLPMEAVQSRCKSWFHSNNENDKKKDSSYDQLLRLNLKDCVMDEGGAVADALLIDNNNDRTDNDNNNNQRNKLLWTGIMRGALQQVLYDKLPMTSTKAKVQFNKRLTHIEHEVDSTTTTTTTTFCHFDDGTITGPYDLIIGCEGINSPLRSYIENNKPQQDDDDDGQNNQKTAIYSGLRIRYAVADGDDDTSSQTTKKAATLTQYFGDGAYALSGMYGAGPNKPNTHVAFIVYLDENYIGPFKINKKKQQLQQQDASPSESSMEKGSGTIGENVDWSQDNRQTVDRARTAMLEQLEKCGIPCNVAGGDDDDDDDDDLLLGRTIANADRFFELGSYYHNPFGKWRSDDGRVVLCGDAAHALPPFLGQGSNQAIQDAFVLAQKIDAYNAQFVSDDDENNNDDDKQSMSSGEEDVRSIQQYLDEYEATRWPSCFQIYWKSAFLGYLETGGTNGIYAKFRDVFFRTMGFLGVARKVLLGAATPKVD